MLFKMFAVFLNSVLVILVEIVSHDPHNWLSDVCLNQIQANFVRY